MQEKIKTEQEQLEEIKMQIRPLDEKSMDLAKKRWMSVAKPLFSLGKLEKAVIQIAGILGTDYYELKKKGLIIMCADNGVVEEGVTQTGQDVTAAVADNFTKGQAICRNLIHRIFLESADIDGIVNQISPASLLTRMFADHGTGRRKRVVLTDHVDRPRIVFLPDQRNVCRDIHMRRTKIDARHLLSHLAGTDMVFNMALIFFPKCIQSLQHFNS